jgi:hypothetical protein
VAISRRAFLKIGGVLLFSPFFKIRFNANASGFPCGYVTVDATAITIDSTIINVATLTDIDCDGLNDKEETDVYQTDPINPDSDEDGLVDGDEVFVYSTLPLNPDTDGDGVLDGQEISDHTDPNNSASLHTSRGDMNDDGDVNAADLLIHQRIIMGDIPLTPELLAKGDLAPLVNGLPAPDGQLTLGDYVVLQRKVLGLINY